MYHRVEPGYATRSSRLAQDRNWSLETAVAQSAAAGYSSTVTAIRHTISADSRIVLSKDQASDLAGELAVVNLKSGVYYGSINGTRIWKLSRSP